jgi:acyl-CoA-dependent ceramide synthase
MTTGCFVGSGEDISGPIPVPKDGRSYLLEPLVSNSGLVCYNATVKHLLLSGLLFLEGLMVVWFVMIAKLVVRVLLGGNAEDTRSDDEEEEEEVDQGNKGSIELEVDEEDLHLHP